MGSFGQTGLKQKISCKCTFKRYSMIVITLVYDFALSHNTFILSKIFIASHSYHSEQIL
jgi:hypothetical protein